MGATIAIITVAGTLALCGIIVWFVLKAMKKEAYTGVVASKHEEELEDANDNPYTAYYLVVKLEDGGQKHVQLGKKLWIPFNVGDKIIKEAGKYNPTKG